MASCSFVSNTAKKGAALMYESIRSANDNASTARETTFHGNVGEESIIDVLVPVEWSCKQG
eukprot:439305-Prymnesium_polylepis.1